MKIEKTADIDPGKSLVLIVYGRGGTGKTTFAATAPKPIIFDFENGTKYLGERGLNADVIRMDHWFNADDKEDLKKIAKEYDTIVIDPLGEAMDKLIESNDIKGQYRKTDGGLTMSGWGFVKKTMRTFIKWLRDTGKNVIIVAHVKEEKTEEGLTHRIQVATGLSDEIPNMVDAICYMAVRKIGDDCQRVLYTPQRGGSFDSKDRTGKIPEVIEVSELTGWEDFKKAMEGNKDGV